MLIEKSELTLTTDLIKYFIIETKESMLHNLTICVLFPDTVVQDGYSNR